MTKYSPNLGQRSADPSTDELVNWLMAGEAEQGAFAMGSVTIETLVTGFSGAVYLRHDDEPLSRSRHRVQIPYNRRYRVNRGSWIFGTG